jgi:hypothetical protein
MILRNGPYIYTAACLFYLKIKPILACSIDDIFLKGFLFIRWGLIDGNILSWGIRNMLIVMILKGLAVSNGKLLIEESAISLKSLQDDFGGGSFDAKLFSSLCQRYTLFQDHLH